LANAQVAEAKESLAQAKANVANDSIKRYDITFNQSELTSNKATLDNAQTTLDQTIVRSPSDGIVVTKDVSQGTYITSGESFNSSGTTIVTIGDVTRMYVQATVDETDLASIDAGQAVSVTFDAYPGLTFAWTRRHRSTTMSPSLTSASRSTTRHRRSACSSQA
jgi:multidrug resistance efflux pump